MKKAATFLTTMLLLCVPLLARSQDKDTNRANREYATQLGGRLEEIIKAKEPKWKLKDSAQGSFGFDQYWKSGDLKVRLYIYVYDTPEEASKKLQESSRASSVAIPYPLEGFGDEAYYMTHRFFGWVGARKGRTFVTIHAPSLDVAKRFAEHALDQLQEQ
jgi:hypothetical protein